MQPIMDPRISGNIEEGFYTSCIGCGSEVKSRFKHTVVRSLTRGNCISCRVHWANVDEDLRQNEDGKWLSSCPDCGVDQPYTRKDHARSSEREGWSCRKCNAKKGHSTSKIGYIPRIYNKFRKSAQNRGIEWGVTLEEVEGCYTGYCALTGWEITSNPRGTASLDRIDSSRGYTPDNIQWVHKMVNMSKNKYDQSEFVRMCKAVANNETVT